jgi:radical SAM superfamily enzyme YgiQ (UPF0313 family)
MILHCTPPYAPDIPNPALGYLKGFLESHGVPVKNVYWNLELSAEINNFNRTLQGYSQGRLFSVDAITVYAWKQLMGINDKTPLSLLFSSVFAEQEVGELISSLKEKIDLYIKRNNLHRDRLHGFTMKTYQWFMNWYVINRLKEMNPDIRIVIGGVTGREQAEAFMRAIPQIDYAVYGEGEYPLLHLTRAVQEGSVGTVPNLVYRGNTVCSTNTKTTCPSLDSYPFADHTDYFDAVKTAGLTNMRVLIPVWGSRSCPWNRCKFCVLNENYQYRTRTPENIVKEIEYQSHNHDNDNFIFVDTDVAGNKKRFLTLLKLLVEASAYRKEPYHFFAEISPLFIDDETAHYMQVASFVSTQVGFEAVTDSLLEKMEKRHRFAHNIQALKAAERYGLSLDGLNIMRGIPAESKEDIIHSITNVKFLRFLINTFALRPAILELHKGSPFYNDMSEENRKKWNYNRFWEEIGFSGQISEADRFEFFGFYRGKPAFSWDDFEAVLASYKQQNRSYTWIEYEDGSFIEESGPNVCKYVLDRDETDILIFCNSLRSLSQVKEEFSHMDEEALCGLLKDFHEHGLVYCDSTRVISILEASKRKTAFTEP